MSIKVRKDAMHAYKDGQKVPIGIVASASEDVRKWLEEHGEDLIPGHEPEDGSITFEKISDELRESLGDPNPFTIFVPKKINSGDCTVVNYKGQNIIIDFGGGEYADLANRIVQKGYTTFKYAMISHYHGDHAGNLESFLSDSRFDFSGCLFFLPATPDYSKCTDNNPYGGMTCSQAKAREEAVKALLTSKRIAFRTPVNNSTVDMDELSCRFLNMDPSDWENSYAYHTGNANGDTINAWSMICEFTHGNTSYLSTGDVNWLVLDKVAPYITKNPDIYKLEHHGQTGTPVPESWSSKICPEYSIMEGTTSPRMDSYGYVLNNGRSKVLLENESVEEITLVVVLDKIFLVSGNTESFASDTLNTVRSSIESGSVNDYITPGSYTISSANFDNISDKPSGAEKKYANMKVVQLWDPSRVLQIWINADGIWTRRLTSNGFTVWVNDNEFTKSYTKQYVFGTNTDMALPNNANLDDYLEEGCWYRKDGSIVVQNSPVNTAFRMECKRINHGDRFVQTIITVEATCYYRRTYSASGWSDWVKHGDTYITPEMFGAKGDGVADDTTAVQNAIDAGNANKKPILLTAAYRTTQPLKINVSGTNILGTGSLYDKNAISGSIRYSGTDYAFKVADGDNDVNDIIIKDILIAASSGGAVWFDKNRVGKSLFENVAFATKKYSILFESDGGYNRFHNCKFMNSHKVDNDEGYVCMDGKVTQGIFPNYVYFVDCNFEASNKNLDLVKLGNCQFVYFDRCDLCNTTGNAIVLEKYANTVYIANTTIFNVDTAFAANTNLSYFSRGNVIINNTHVSAKKFINSNSHNLGIISLTNNQLIISEDYMPNGGGGTSIMGTGNIFNTAEVPHLSTFPDGVLGLPFYKVSSIPSGASSIAIDGTHISGSYMPYNVKVFSTNPNINVVSVTRNSPVKLTVNVNNTSSGTQDALLIVKRN